MKPFVKWAGGKRQLLKKIEELLPEKYNTYYEPFIGGGALFFHLAPKKAIINDVNEELITVYNIFKKEKDLKLLMEKLSLHEKNHSKEYYYEIRQQDRENSFKKMDKIDKAARMIYLNKAGFNGLYRVNSKGEFNVPFGQKEKINTYDKENFLKIHQYFKKSDINVYNKDFVKAVENAKKGDFVYFDPPYDKFEDANNFTSYSKDEFDRKDQKRLQELFVELDKKGVYLMLSNHNTNYIKELYKDYNIKIVKARRMINSNSSKRGPVEEVLITNY